MTCADGMAILMETVRCHVTRAVAEEIARDLLERPGDAEFRRAVSMLAKDLRVRPRADAA